PLSRQWLRAASLPELDQNEVWCVSRNANTSSRAAGGSRKNYGNAASASLKLYQCWTRIYTEKQPFVSISTPEWEEKLLNGTWLPGMGVGSWIAGGSPL